MAVAYIYSSVLLFWLKFKLKKKNNTKYVLLSSTWF